MDTAASDAAEPVVRPKRQSKPPSHLSDYEVGYIPPVDPPPISSSRCHSQHKSQSRKTSHSKASSHSRSSGHSIISGVQATSALTSSQAAMVDERIKQRQYDNLLQQIEEDTLAEIEYQRLQTQAKEAQRVQEEALMAKEALTNQLERRRKLKKAETDLEVAKLVNSLLSQDLSVDDAGPEGSPDTTVPPSQLLHASPVQSPVPQQFPCPVSSMIQATQTVSEAQSIDQSLKNPPLTLQATMPLQVPAYTAQLSACTVTQTQGRSQVAHYEENMSHVLQQPSPVSIPLPPFSPVQQAATQLATPYTGSVLISQTKPPVAPIASTSHVNTPLPRQSAPLMSQNQPIPTTHHRAPLLSNTPICPQPYSPLPVPQAGYIPQPGTELLMAAAYGIPRPTLPVFESGTESDFALLKLALDNLLSHHTHISEQYKYQVLLSHLKFASAQQLAKAYMHHPQPYTTALQALQEKYGQPRQLVQSELGAIMSTPPLKMGDSNAFDSFALSVQSLVGMLRTLEGQNGYELMCGSHVDRLLSKLPPAYRDGFVEYCLSHGILQTGTDRTYTLPDFASWLQTKSQAKRISSRAAAVFQSDTTKSSGKSKYTPYHRERSTPILLTSEKSVKPSALAQVKVISKPKPYCPHCDNQDHYLNSCDKFKRLTTAQIITWIAEGKRCWKCGRNHSADSCNLKRPCKVCKELHLTVLHDSINDTSRAVLMVSLPSTQIYLDRPNRSQKVMLKVVRVLLHNGGQTMEAHAVLDDGSERTIVLPQVVRQLRLNGAPEVLPLQTIHQSHTKLDGSTVTFEVSSLTKPTERYVIRNAFTASGLSLAEHTYPVAALQKAYRHLRGLPLQPVDNVKPLLLIGSDMPHLLTPVQPVRRGAESSPIAICTKLGWVLQGPMCPIQPPKGLQQCLHIMTAPTRDELYQHVERLWQVDTVPYNEKVITRSKQDQQCYNLLQTATVRVNVDGVLRYATPLLRRTPITLLNAGMESVLPSLRNIERKLAKNPEQAQVYCSEIQKLESAGYIAKIAPDEVDKSTESWFIPHHIVHHNGKDRIVYNCSFQYHGQSLNEQLLPGPTLGPSLLGVILRFRQHAVAVSGDIKGMFHQVRLLPGDKSVLRFIWRNMNQEAHPDIYEWQVLPFGTTCSPCCATYALQYHAQEYRHTMAGLVDIVETSFYVDNCLHSTPDQGEAKAIIDGLRQSLLQGGFEIRQWASNVPSILRHLPSEARSASSECWLSQSSTDLQELTLGLQWNCLDDTLGYRNRVAEPAQPTMRNLYKTLASQYDPLGFILPFTTRAKTLIQDLWKHNLSWDDPIEPLHLREKWSTWIAELSSITKLQFPRPYAPGKSDTPSTVRELHVFCDASERVYGSVAYLQVTDESDEVHVTFVLARSRVAPRKCLSMPRLELCAALSGAQMAKVIQTELTIPIHQVTYWTDSTTVLHWLKSESCRYKVFVGSRVAEIQTLTDVSRWRYVDSARNPADHITRGLTLVELACPHQWRSGPSFLTQPQNKWPALPSAESEPDLSEIKRASFVGAITVVPSPVPLDFSQFRTWKELLQATVESCDGAANSDNSSEASRYIQAEKLLLAQAQLDSFPEELRALKAGQFISTDSRLRSLAPEYDKDIGLIRVGGRLRRIETLPPDVIHPIVLDPQHQVTKLLIQDIDQQLNHPGAERVLAELRRRYWVLRGREAVRRHQHFCQDCQFWRSKPQNPKMADLPPCRLRLFKPPFFSTGVDCFGPFQVKIGRRQEKRWGILYKCLTTRCLHLDLLEHLDTDAFLLSLRRFIARRGKPFEILCDNGTNFTGGDHELRESFSQMTPELQTQLAKQQIQFRYIPPSAPHFGGTWEREVKSVKTALRVILREQSVPESVLQTLLVEVEGILNSKPLGYVSSDIADPDPVTPNMLLMGRRDASLPQVLYDSNELLGKRRWRHSQVLADQFWTAFIRSYLPELQGRQKWTSDGKGLAVGQVVLLIDHQLPRALWPVGTVTETYAGADKRIRTAKVKVKDKMYLRPVVKLIPLPPKRDEDKDTLDGLS